MARTMALLLISLCVLLALVTAESEPTTCSDDKKHDDCGSSCPSTCDNLKPNCPQRCVPGCFCKSGTVDNGLGECVEMEKCKLCSGNTTYTECVYRCPKLKIPTKCPIPCIKGCACKTNYKRLPDSDKCVLSQDLPKSGSNN